MKYLSTSENFLSENLQFAFRNLKLIGIDDIQNIILPSDP